MLLTLVIVLLTVVIVTPVALSAQDLIDWAAAPSGLNLPKPWPLLVFLALDAAAAACVLLTVYCAWRGEPAGVFGLLVWCFATASAFANWRHNQQPGSPPDAVWFFPAMSLAGPALLEAVLGRFRHWAQRDHGRRHRRLPAYGWRRWTPGLGALRDTYGAYRTALLTGIDTVDESITAYHRLCPDGTLRIATALRNRTNHNPRQETEPTENKPAQVDPAQVNPAALPVDLMRRIPIQPEAYQRWRTAWAQLRHNPNRRGDLKPVAERNGFSIGQVEFIRRAGQAGLLDSATPPALRLAALAGAGAGLGDT